MCCRQLEKCFFGWSLQSGTQAIGLSALFKAIEHFFKGLPTLTMILSITGVPVNDDTALILLISPIAEIAASVIVIAATVPLLIAATKNSRPGLLLPWLILATIGLVALTVLAVMFGIGAGVGLSGSLGIVMSIGSICVSGLLFILEFALAIYVWMVIFSYYKQLKEMEVQRNTANKFQI